MELRDPDTMTADERVAEGVAWLEATGYAAWVEEIDWERFDIESSCNCILGQLDRDYTFALDHVLPPPDRFEPDEWDAWMSARTKWARQRGFCPLTDKVDSEVMLHDIRKLNHAWLERAGQY